MGDKENKPLTLLRKVDMVPLFILHTIIHILKNHSEDKVFGHIT